VHRFLFCAGTAVRVVVESGVLRVRMSVRIIVRQCEIFALYSVLVFCNLYVVTRNLCVQGGDFHAITSSSQIKLPLSYLHRSANFSYGTLNMTSRSSLYFLGRNRRGSNFILNFRWFSCDEIKVSADLCRNQGFLAMKS
jgi:hypothetical protein